MLPLVPEEMIGSLNLRVFYLSCENLKDDFLDAPSESYRLILSLDDLLNRFGFDGLIAWPLTATIGLMGDVCPE